jgi:hypothetical protein
VVAKVEQTKDEDEELTREVGGVMGGRTYR